MLPRGCENLLFFGVILNTALLLSNSHLGPVHMNPGQ